jgi:hypothetical protein
LEGVHREVEEICAVTPDEQPAHDALLLAPLVALGSAVAGCQVMQPSISCRNSPQPVSTYFSGASIPSGGVTPERPSAEASIVAL